MVKQTQLALNDAAEWLGDWHPLAEQLGSASGLVALGSLSRQLELPAVHSLNSLRSFLREYQSAILFDFELPAVRTAYAHTAAHEFRELAEFDRRLAAAPELLPFANASRRVGQAQLRKLRPLRDLRFIRKYINAIDAGEANGWHTLVYGVTLEVYSLPLRQGLLGYAHQTTRGFIYAAARSLRLSERDCRKLFNELCAGLPAAVETLLPAQALA